MWYIINVIYFFKWEIRQLQQAAQPGNTGCVAFFFWQLATSAGTLPTPCELERETEFQTVHSTLIKWHCVCWPLHLSYNGTLSGVFGEARGMWSQCHHVWVTGCLGFRSWRSARYEQPFKTGWVLCLSESCRCELCGNYCICNDTLLKSIL